MIFQDSRRSGMEPVFFFVPCISVCVAPVYTCEMQTQAQMQVPEMMKIFPFLASALTFAFALGSSHVYFLAFAFAFASYV